MPSIFFFIREIQEKLRKTECLREDIVRLIEEQEEWKKHQKRIEAEENEKITHYIAEQDERSKQLKEVEHEKRLAMIEQQEKLCSELDEIEVILIISKRFETIIDEFDWFSVKNWNERSCLLISNVKRSMKSIW